MLSGTAPIIIAINQGEWHGSWRRLYREQGLDIFPTINHPAPSVSESVQPDAAQEAVKEKPKTKKQSGKGIKRRKQMKKDKAKKGKAKKTGKKKK